MRKTLLTLMCVVSMITTAYAGGFRVSLQGVKQAAMGHTGVAVVHDASSVFFNPAGLALIDSKWSVSANVFGLLTDINYQNRLNGASHDTDNPLGTPLALYVSHKLSDKLAVGLGVYTPYGSTVDWGKDWSGQALIRDIALQSFFIQPTISYKLNDWASVGAGFIYATGSVKMNRGANSGGTNIGNANIESDSADGIGYNLGLMLKPHEKVQVGVNYRSRIDMEAEGEAKIVYEGTGLAGVPNGAVLASDDWKATLPLPAELAFGIAYMPTAKWVLEFDLNYAFWSAYKSLDFDFVKGDIPDSSSKREYENTLVYRMGASYDFNDRWTGRLGAYYDESPSPGNYFSPETPTVDNKAISTGLTYNFKNGFSIDGTYMFLSGEERSFSNIETGWTGEVKASAHIFGLGASYNF
ncbi:MAG: OmpP1/FadL family transporter [Flavobacteriales bacterium]